MIKINVMEFLNETEQQQVIGLIEGQARRILTEVMRSIEEGYPATAISMTNEAKKFMEVAEELRTHYHAPISLENGQFIELE